MQSVTLSDDASYFWLGSTSTEPKSIFSTTDEKVTLRVVFQPNFVGKYRTFTVEWIAPDGSVYLADPVGTKFGTNQILIATLPIANNEPSHMPGKWRVRLLYQSQELASRNFTIASATALPAETTPIGVDPRPADVRRLPALVPSKAYSTSWALVVGINDYRYAPTLSYAVNDARAVTSALGALGFDHIRLLLDGEATKAAIERIIYDEYQSRMGADDRLFVFFAGHGITVSLPRGAEEGYLVPVDGDPERPALTAIAMDEIRKIGRRVKAKHILFAIDSCFSGFAVTRDITSGGVKDADLAAALQEPVVQVMTAGRKGQKAIEEQGHGLFTRRLLEGLRGLADRDRRGFITATQLCAWLGPRVTRDSGGMQTPQFSALEGEGDFVFVLPAEER